MEAQVAREIVVPAGRRNGRRLFLYELPQRGIGLPHTLRAEAAQRKIAELGFHRGAVGQQLP